jgi:hypothetical protein
MNSSIVGRVLYDNQSGRSDTMGRRLVSSSLALVFMTTLLVTAVASAQTVSVPRTPWGDPDIQGNYTNTYEQGTPLERPEQFAGRTLEDVKGEELARVRRQIQERTIGNFQGPIHAPDHWWQDNLYLERGSQAWLIVDPPDGKIPPLTPEAQRRSAARAEARKKSGRGPADSWEDRSLYDRCITRGLPNSGMPTIYGNSSEIVQAPGVVVIRYEMIHEARVIPLDGRPPVGKIIDQDMGDSRGRWEGDTLVVETTNFKERSVFRNANPDTLKLTERFTRIAPDKLRWTVTIEDPATWTKPWTFSVPLHADKVPLPSYECHEGNYGLKNILSAARAEEREAAVSGRPVRQVEENRGADSAAPAEGR